MLQFRGLFTFRFSELLVFVQELLDIQFLPDGCYLVEEMIFNCMYYVAVHRNIEINMITGGHEVMTLNGEFNIWLNIVS